MLSDLHFIRVLVAETVPLFQRGIVSAIQETNDIRVVGLADQEANVFELATSLDPDVLVGSPAVLGNKEFELARRLRLTSPNLGILVIGRDDDQDLLFSAVKAGVSGYLPRYSDSEELVGTIRRIGNGEHVIDEQVLTSPVIASRVLRQFNALSDETPTEMKPLFAPLSPREIEILDHISRGNSNKQIARILTISDQTVKNHVTSILKKLSVNDRTEAVVYSLRQGWIKMEDGG